MTLFALMRKRRPVRVEDVRLAVSSHCSPAAHVIATVGEGRTILLDTRRDRYMGLDGVASSVWGRLGTGADVGAIVESIAAEFEAPFETIEKDVLDLLRTLALRGLIEVA